MTTDELAEIVADYLRDRDDIADVTLNQAPGGPLFLEVVTQGGIFYDLKVERTEVHD